LAYLPLIGKIPLKQSNGHKDATTNPQQIEVWWTKHPSANIGLATGVVSGVLVLEQQTVIDIRLEHESHIVQDVFPPLAAIPELAT
jgi:Bifunctional DNA primase/polymerase, N-terminal